MVKKIVRVDTGSNKHCPQSFSGMSLIFKKKIFPVDIDTLH